MANCKLYGRVIDTDVLSTEIRASLNIHRRILMIGNLDLPMLWERTVDVNGSQYRTMSELDDVLRLNRHLGATHQHYKGGLYRRLGIIRDADTGEYTDRTGYLHIFPYAYDLWSRKTSEFDESNRFRPLIYPTSTYTVRSVEDSLTYGIDRFANADYITNTLRAITDSINIIIIEAEYETDPEFGPRQWCSPPTS